MSAFKECFNISVGFDDYLIPIGQCGNSAIKLFLRDLTGIFPGVLFLLTRIRPQLAINRPYLVNGQKLINEHLLWRLKADALFLVEGSKSKSMPSFPQLYQCWHRENSFHHIVCLFLCKSANLDFLSGHTGIRWFSKTFLQGRKKPSKIW